MTDLADLFEQLVEQPLAPVPSIDDLCRRNRRRRRRAVVRAGSGAVVAVVAAVLVIVLALSPPSPGGGLAGYLVPATDVPLAVLEAVGVPSTVRLPTPLSDQPALEVGGRPELFYAGAAFCPYCAVSRWALVIALSEFGTFSDLGSIISSASNEPWPGLQSWSFAGSSYSSAYLSFDPVELSYQRTGQPPTPGPAAGYVPISTLSPPDRHLLQAYDQPGGGSIPFIDIANKVVVVGASGDPAPLEGLSLGQISSQLSDPSTAVARLLDGTANTLIANICSLVGAQSASICSAPFVQQTLSRQDPNSGVGPGS